MAKRREKLSPAIETVGWRNRSAVGRPAVEILRPRTDKRSVADIVHLARLLDNRFVVPGTGIRFGLDALLGLIPAVGDGISAALSLYIIARAKHLGAPDALLAKMGWNVAIDTAIGAFPIVGDVFDVAFKANLKNVRLLLDHLGVSDAAL
ncbi:MAG: DUF4112 domain-containing protein [Caulobacterales bacterium]